MEPHGALVVVSNVLHAWLVVALQPLAELGHLRVLIFRQVQTGTYNRHRYTTVLFKLSMVNIKKHNNEHSCTIIIIVVVKCIIVLLFPDRSTSKSLH